ncbi:hypothetical protein FNV43_RR27188 [Rhamnella rubrinervis]|uniref:PIN-like protein n=1 Tax=Rhamnella rubrinervis TaxID=2594499 RepID=A0A8K0GPX7_9ROSA|nr:hypothetical protein FNV43_RR27188 [Rhamnella rubrinervis]
MISWSEVYNVLVAMAPLYFAMGMGFGFVRWWNIIKPEQTNAIGQFVYYLSLPLLGFEFISNVNPFHWNYRFIAADAICKLLIIVLLSLWTKFSSKGSFGWLITGFSLCSLTNLVVIGVPLLKAMYGQLGVDMVIQSAVFQGILWQPIVLFLMEFRRSKQVLYVSNPRVNSGHPSFWSFVKALMLKLVANPNVIALFIGIIWALISSRYHIHMPRIIDDSIKIVSNCGAGTAMFCVGIFMAIQENILSCGPKLIVLGLVLRFIAAPAAMAIGSIAVGLRGDVLRIAVIQGDIWHASVSWCADCVLHDIIELVG